MQIVSVIQISPKILEYQGLFLTTSVSASLREFYSKTPTSGDWFLQKCIGCGLYCLATKAGYRMLSDLFGNVLFAWSSISFGKPDYIKLPQGEYL